MTRISKSMLDELSYELKQAQIDVHLDKTTRILYSTDASIYEIEPLGVVFPKCLDELNATVEIAARYETPILARGAGSSLAGQAVGSALILDCSRYLNRIIELNPESGSATVEPGVIMADLNHQASVFGLQFGPDPASADRATMGGSIVNNATGAHSIIYGMAADHLSSIDLIFGDGSQARLESITLEDAYRMAGLNYAYPGEQSIDDLQEVEAQTRRSQEAEFYRAALGIRDKYADTIKRQWPKTWRRVSGYNLNYLLPWSPATPPRWDNEADFKKQNIPYPPIEPGRINLAPLLAGSEGTLGVVRSATIRLVPVRDHHVLGVLSYSSLPEACEAVPELLEAQPSAIELIPQSLIQLAQSVPAYARQLDFVEGSPAALLVVEFSGHEISPLIEQVKNLRKDIVLATTPEEQTRIWNVRKVGLGILSSRPGDLKSTAVIEDIPVPVEHLGEYVRGILRIFDEHGVQGDFYAHASAGCLHIRPLLNLKTQDGRKLMRSISSQAVGLSIGLGGAVSGEHGDGLARSEWLSRLYGPQILRAMGELKRAADPKGLLNPGKIVDPLPMDKNLRFGEDYKTRAWRPVMDFSREGVQPGEQGLARAIEMCNGAGVCRKSDGVMCPSFQATQDEMHSTRGRANLLRAMISGKFPQNDPAERSVYEALDLCLACKGCKSECPSAVDIAKLKYEFEYRYYQSRSRKLRDYLFAHIDRFAHFGYRLAPIANYLMNAKLPRLAAENLFGLSSKRKFPRLSTKTFQQLARNIPEPRRPTAYPRENVLLLSDAFTEYFYPQVGLSALRALNAAGSRVITLPVIGAGRTLISKGMLAEAKSHAMRLVDAIERLSADGLMEVVGLEPSEILTLRDEYPDLFPKDERVSSISKRSWMIDEYLVRPGETGLPRMEAIMKQRVKDPGTRVLLHGHCYQKAQPPSTDGYPTGEDATIAMLEAAGHEVSLIDSGCCGMAGAFGYETEHYQVSIDVGELNLLPAIRDAEESVLIAASGVSCQSQISDATDRKCVHPIRLIL